LCLNAHQVLLFVALIFVTFFTKALTASYLPVRDVLRATHGGLRKRKGDSAYEAHDSVVNGSRCDGSDAGGDGRSGYGEG
jgi:hypothetical protein